MDYDKRMQTCHTLITEEAVKAALKGDKGSEAHLSSWRIEDFTKKGDNYAAMVTSVKVDFTLDGKKEHVSYVVKINPCHGFQQFEKFTETVFAKEAEFYLKLLPKLNSVLKETGLKPLAMAHGYHGCLEEGKQLVFLEDLRPRGFKMFDRRKGLDSAHATLVIKELANLHAASLLLQKKEPDYHKDTLLHRGWFNLTDKPGEVIEILSGQLDMGIKMLTKIGGYESTISWIESTKAQLNDLFEKQMEPSKYQVLCHGDAWNNNLLFRYDEEGSPVEAMLVDLQMCRRESFAIDLNYLLYTSLTGAVRKPNLDSLLEGYRRQFNSVMEAGGGEMLLEHKEVKAEFLSKNIFGVIFSIMVVGALLAEPEDIPEFQSSGEENDTQKLMEEYGKLMLELLDTNPLLRPRFLAVFDEMLEAGLIPK